MANDLFGNPGLATSPDVIKSMVAAVLGFTPEPFPTSGLGWLHDDGVGTRVFRQLVSSDITSALGYTPLANTAQAADSAKLGGVSAALFATQAWVNGLGFITGITSGMVTGALGFTPLPATGQAADSAKLGGVTAANYALATNIPSAYGSNPAVDGTASPGSSTSWARGDHVHPVDTSRQAASTILSAFGALASSAGWLRNDGSGALSYSTPTASQVGALSAGGGTLTGLLKGTQALWNGALATAQASSLSLDQSNSTTSRLVAMGPNTSTPGTLVLAVSNSDTSGYVATVIFATALVTFGVAVQAPSYKVGGTQVLGAQQTGLGAQLGANTLTGTYSTDKTALQNLYNKVVALETALRAHGLVTT